MTDVMSDRGELELEILDGRELLTAPAAAKLLGIHPSTLKRSRLIPYYQVGRAGWRRYRRADLEAELERTRR